MVRTAARRPIKTSPLPRTALRLTTGFGPVATKTRDTSTNVDHTFSRPLDSRKNERSAGGPAWPSADGGPPSSPFYRDIADELQSPGMTPHFFVARRNLETSQSRTRPRLAWIDRREGGSIYCRCVSSE
ncbi:hypothetical protein KM043_008571 [Ampulex compressa]|nr:hypothetical protein KM043_008571 [Ampulex compressa]